jgi:hypothetical protein
VRWNQQVVRTTPDDGSVVQQPQQPDEGVGGGGRGEGEKGEMTPRLVMGAQRMAVWKG